MASRRDDLRFSWDVLSAWARDLPPAWNSRLESIDNWNGVQYRECEEWCELERVAWGRLAHWAGEPLDEERRPAAWGSSPERGRHRGSR